MGTFFFRNRPELELLTRILDAKAPGSVVDLTILGCSKGAEVYSFSYSIRRARPDLRVHIRALDISADVLQFAQGATYSLKDRVPHQDSGSNTLDPDVDLALRTFGDQSTWIFERMSTSEIESMFECEGDRATVRQSFRDGISWHVGDAGDSKLSELFGLQDIVVANRFLCHMQPEQAEMCLRNLSHLVKPGGYLFVSGLDLNVRSKVARALGWKPVTTLIREIHDGDMSIRQDWPLQYWGLEPFDENRRDRDLHYAAVFQIGVESSTARAGESSAEKPQMVLAHDRP
jgi:chemotaxis methyl-accepting protein methylase